jgi:hypothetical protein
MKRMLRHSVLFFFLVLISVAPNIMAQDSSDSFYARGAFYLDWFGAKYEETDFFSQVGTRLKMELISRRGNGWTLQFDARERFRAGEASNNQVLLYDARLHFERPQSRILCSIGQMNLYDTAGIGQLLGGVLGFKINPDWLFGGYAGWDSSVYINRVESGYRKFGIFGRFLGTKGKRLSFSYNQVRYSGMTERQYIYAGAMFPVERMFVFYGNFEYELASNVSGSDRLSRVFFNARWDPARSVDLIAFYSSGRGLDFHRHVLKRSQDPELNDSELERFYYSLQYGLRFSVKPTKMLRLYLSRRESEQKDDNIRNHTWQLGGSVGNILDSGLMVYGSYSSNRGEISESDSYFLSLSRDFGPVSWNASFSNTYNGVRFSRSNGDPEIIHLNDYKTLSTQFFVPFNRTFAASMEYEYFIQENDNQHLIFLRLIIRN